MLRLATLEDYPEILRMSRAFAAVSPYKSLTVSESGVYKVLENFVNSDKTSSVIVLAGTPEKTYGMIAGHKASGFLWEENTAHELIWWVDPEYRKSRDTLMLWHAFEQWAIKVGARQVSFSDLPEVTDLDKFYTKKGYRQVEKAWVKHLPEDPANGST